MNRKTRLLLLMVCFSAGGLLQASNPRLNFGSRNSALKFSPNTTLYVNSADSVMQVDGTIVKDAAAEFSGNRIAFSNGVLESEGSEILMTAGYQPGTKDSIWLEGDSLFDAEPGIVVQKMYVDGINNRLEGQPQFIDTISFYDSATTLTIAIQNRLNKNIELNGGELRLADNLYLGDTVSLVGPGLIRLNNCQLALGSYYSSAWTTDINWNQATDVVLNGRTELTGQWSFVGINVLNGNGNVLDLSGGGTIYVSPGSTLDLTDVHIRGISDTDGQIILGDENARINTYNCEIELIGDYTTTTGKFWVGGPTTFILKDKDWTFNNDSLLTVDGVTLWLDTLDQTSWPEPGQLKAPLALYAGHYWQTENLAYDLVHNLSLIYSGTVKEVCDRSQTWSSKSTALTDGILTHDLTLDQSIHIHPQQKITIGADLTIDGDGATLVFSNPENSQFVVLPGYTVTLKNVELDRVNSRTFDLRYAHGGAGQPTRSTTNPNDIVSGNLIIGEDVAFGLSESVTFSQGTITLLDESSSSKYNTFKVRGVEGPKTFTINPRVSNATHNVEFYMPTAISPVTGQPANQGFKSLILNQNSISLEDVELTGLDHISHVVGTGGSGSIAMAGRGVVDVGNIHRPLSQSSSIEYVDKVFDISGLDNRLRLLKDKLVFSGQVNFAEENDNVLHIDSVIIQRILGADKTQWWTGGSPEITFNTNFANLTSTYGIARLIFDDRIIQVTNQADGFKLAKNSFLGGKHLIIGNNPIVNNYDGNLSGQPPTTELERLTAKNIPTGNPITKDFGNMFRAPVTSGSGDNNGRYVTAFQLLQQKEREAFRPELIPSNGHVYAIPTQKPSPRPGASSSRPGERPRSRDLLTRDVNLPDNVNDLSVDVETYVDATDLQGQEYAYRTYLDKFSTDGTESLNLTLDTECYVSVLKSEDVTIKSGDIINIVGAGNEIHIAKKLTIETGAQLNFDDGTINSSVPAQLRFVFDNDDAELVIGGITIDLEESSDLIFTGKGKAKLSDSCVINMKGLRDSTTGAVSNIPSLIVTGDVELDVLSLATAQIKGVGRIIVSEGGLLNVDTATLKVGATRTDDITLNVFSAGMVNVMGTDADAYGRISFINTNMTINVVQNASITLNDYGVLEINSVGNDLEKGNLTQFIVDATSTLYINENAILSLAANFYEWQNGYEIVWDTRGARVIGNGYVELITQQPSTGRQYRGYIGKLQTANAQFFSGTTGYSAEQIVQKLTNKTTALTKSTHFTDFEDDDMVRFSSNARKTAVTSGDTISSENTDGSRIFGTNSNGSSITYVDNGTRLA